MAAVIDGLIASTTTTVTTADAAASATIVTQCTIAATSCRPTAQL